MTITNITFFSVTADFEVTGFAPNEGTTWSENGDTVAGKGLSKLNCPCGLYVDHHETIYIADNENHRVVKLRAGDKESQVIAGGKGSGNGKHQLCEPTDVVIDKKRNCIYICDYGNKRVMRWPLNGGEHGEIIIPDIRCICLTIYEQDFLYISELGKHTVEKWQIQDTPRSVMTIGKGKGNGLNQFDHPSYLFVDKDETVYVSDVKNNRVMKWKKDAKEGIRVAGDKEPGNSLTQLRSPAGLIVDHQSNVYVVDCMNHRIMHWPKDATEGIIVAGGYGKGNHPKQLNWPDGMSFDQHMRLYVADCRNHRVQRFNIADGTPNPVQRFNMNSSANSSICSLM